MLAYLLRVKNIFWIIWMKKQKNKQGKRASHDMKIKNYINVQNANGCLNTVARVICHNKIKYIPKISVIVPVFNAQNYLKACLDSIVNQTLRDIEIICVDDGSTDKSLDILKDYASKDKRISVLSQKNLHAGIARNAGIAIAKGKYVSFLDADDFFELDMLEKVFGKADKDKSDIVIFGHWAYDNKTKQNIHKVLINEKYTKVSPVNPLSYKNSIFTCCNPNPWNKITKRDLFIDNGLRFENFSSCNDITCVCALLTVAEKISFMSECFVHYRINTDTSISSTRANKVENFLYAADKLERKLISLKKEEYYIGFVERISKSLYWETKHFTQEQKENLQYQARKIFSSKLYNELFGTKISIIIPVYNTESYLCQCLESAINQTLKDIEIICVDDGSLDNSLNILREYEKKDNRIIVLTQKNQRQGAARNNALKIAQGKYIQFLDSDDYLSLDACEKLYNKCEMFQLDMLSFGGINFNNDTGKTIKSDYYNFKWLPDNWHEEVLYCNWKHYIPYMAVSAALTIYRRNFILVHNLVFPEKIYFEDNLFFVKAILNAQKFSVIKEVLYFRRVHKESTTQNWDKNYSDFLKISNMVLEYVAKNDKRYLNKYIRHYLTLCIQGYNCLSCGNKVDNEKDLRKILLKYQYPDIAVKYHISIKSILLKVLNLPFYMYYICKNVLNFYYNITSNEKILRTFRIDVKNYGTHANSVQIQSENIKVTKTKWNTDNTGVGVMLQGSNIKNVVQIKIINNGVLRFNFRGPDQRFKGKRFPIYIDYKSIKIDGKELVSSPLITWHDKPYVYEMDVVDGQEVLLAFEQVYHNYKYNELKDIVIKLNANDECLYSNLNIIK